MENITEKKKKKVKAQFKNLIEGARGVSIRTNFEGLNKDVPADIKDSF